MGSIPGIALTTAGAVVMPHIRSTLAMARPPEARCIAVAEQRAIGVAASEDVVPLRCHLRATLGEGSIPGQIDAFAVEFLNAGSDLNSVRVEPRPPADPVSRVDCWRIG